MHVSAARALPVASARAQDAQRPAPSLTPAPRSPCMALLAVRRCEPSGPVNAHLFVEKLSILYAYKLFPSQAQACELQVEILPAT